MESKQGTQKKHEKDGEKKGGSGENKYKRSK